MKTLGKSLFFLFSFFSSLPVTPPSPSPPHVIMTNLLPRAESSMTVLALQKKYHIPAERSILLREDRELPSSLDTTLVRQLTLDQLVSSHEKGNKDDHVIPPFHVYTRFHHDYLYSRYSQIVSYPQYCLAEEDIAQLVVHLIHQPDPFLFIVQKSEWFFDESFQSFLTKEEKKEIDTTLMIDLDAHPHLDILPRTNHRLLFWNRYERPTI